MFPLNIFKWPSETGYLNLLLVCYLLIHDWKHLSQALKGTSNHILLPHML